MVIGIDTLETGTFSGMQLDIDEAVIGCDKTSVVTTFVAETSEFITIGFDRTSTPVTAEQISARAWSCAVFTSGIIIEDCAEDVVGVVRVIVMHVFIEGIIGGRIGAIALTG